VILEEANRMSQEQDSVAVVGAADADDPVGVARAILLQTR